MKTSEFTYRVVIPFFFSILTVGAVLYGNSVQYGSDIKHIKETQSRQEEYHKRWYYQHEAEIKENREKINKLRVDLERYRHSSFSSSK